MPSRTFATGLKLLRTLCLWLCLTSCTTTMGCRVLRDRESKVPYARELSLRGADALQQRKFGEAEQLFVDALRQSPNDERAQWGYSEVLWQRGEHVLATRHMVQAVELSGSNPELLVRLGQMYLEQKDFTNAQAQADAALKTHRNNPAAWALKADLLRADGKLEEAIDCYQRALLYRPDWPEVQVTVAELYRLSHRPQRALATLDRLTDQRSENQMPPRAYLLRGQALADMGERDAALVYLRNATPKVPADQSNLLYEFAEVQYQLGDLVEARLCLGRALQHNPNLNTALRLQTELDRLLEHPIDSKIPAVLVGHTNPR